MDSFNLLQRYYEIDDADFKQRIGELSELLNVERLLNVHVRKLSLGERMKVELMSCLLHKPEIIFLDEPTIGLDLIGQKNIRDFLQNYHQQTKTTILITSHYMADIDALCKKLVLIIDGKKRFDDTIQRFETLLGNEKMVAFSFSDPVQPDTSFWKRFQPQWNKEFTRVELNIPESEVREVSRVILQDYPVCDFSTEKMPIERVMKTLLENPRLVGAGR